MSDDNNSGVYEKPKYASYNAFGRTAMVWGIPFMPAIMIFAISAVGPLLTQSVLGVFCLVFPLTGIPILLFLKFKCSNDDMAIRIYILEIRCILKRSLYQLMGKTLTFFPIKYGRNRNDAKRYFKKG